MQEIFAFNCQRHLALHIIHFHAPMTINVSYVHAHATAMML